MLLSILFSLLPTQRAPVLGPLGRPLNKWFLDQVALTRPRLADWLHDGPGQKPYTVSTLLDGRGRPLASGTWLQPREEVWLRVTAFDGRGNGPDGESLSAVLLDETLPRLQTQLEIYRMKFRLEGWTLDPAQHPWAGQASYTQWAQGEDRTGRAERHTARLEFASPTAFRSQGADIPLPLPGQVFRSLWRKWNDYAPEAAEIQDIWPGFAEACIMVSELTAVNTERWKFAEGTHGVALGFTGVASFTLLDKNKVGEWSEVWDGAAGVLQSLARFAFYAGVGHHTTVGMGQTRPFGT